MHGHLQVQSKHMSGDSLSCRDSWRGWNCLQAEGRGVLYNGIQGSMDPVNHSPEPLLRVRSYTKKRNIIRYVKRDLVSSRDGDTLTHR